MTRFRERRRRRRMLDVLWGARRAQAQELAVRQRLRPRTGQVTHLGRRIPAR